MKKIGYVKPRRSEDIDRSPWGVCFYVLPDFPVSVEKLAEITGTLGVKWARVNVHWTLVEAEKGRYRWDSIDEQINALAEHRIQIYATVSGGNPAYTEDFRSPPTQTPESLGAWTTFLEKLVNRYKDRVKYWEIWNEPDGHLDPDVYALLVKKASETIKQVSPEAMILAGVLGTVNIPYAEKIFARGIAKYIDKFTYHPYNEFPESCVNLVRLWPVSVPPPPPPHSKAKTYYYSYLVRDLEHLVKSQNSHIALWQGECGYPSTEHSVGWRGKGPWGEKIQAKWLLRRLLVDVSLGVEVASYFVLMDYKDRGGGFNTKGLIRYETLKPKPAYFAYQNLTSLMNDSVSPTQIKTEFEIQEKGSFYGARPETIQVVALSKRGEKPMLAYWLPWKPQEIVRLAQASLVAENDRFKDPVLVDLLEGAVYEIGHKVLDEDKIFFSDLPLADYPMLIASRQSVEIVSERHGY